MQQPRNSLIYTSSESSRVLFVGGCSSTSSASAPFYGLSCVFADHSLSKAEPIIGSRPAFVFNTDPAVTFSVQYEMNGGSPQIPPTGVQSGQDYTISDTIPVKNGYIFGGWSDGTATYGPGDTIQEIRENITLTAVWGHTVTFDLGGGTGGPDTGFVEDGDDYTIPDTEPQMEGFDFGGWSDGVATYEPGGTIQEVRQNIVLTAVWKEASDPEPTPKPLPIFPDDETADGNHPVVIVPETEEQSWLGKNGKTVLIIAVIAAIIAELAVLAYSRRH